MRAKNMWCLGQKLKRKGRSGGTRDIGTGRRTKNPDETKSEFEKNNSKMEGKKLWLYIS